jgi:hypothetical protein
VTSDRPDLDGDGVPWPAEPPPHLDDPTALASGGGNGRPPHRRHRPDRHQAEPGAPLLAELHAALCRYVVLPSPEAADAVTLWIAASHAQPAWEHAPRLAVVSPLKRCGKSRLLDVVAETCWAPLITVNATIAAVVRSIGADPPTLLVDEADTLWGSKRQADNNEDLRGLLNAGHQRNRPMLRWDVTSRTAEHLDTPSPWPCWPPSASCPTRSWTALS